MKPDLEQIQQLMDLVLTKFGYGFATLIAVCLIGLWAKNIAQTLFSYLGTKFSDLGTGSKIEWNGERWRVDEIRYTFIVLRSVKRKGIVARMPIGQWCKLIKVICFTDEE